MRMAKSLQKAAKKSGGSKQVNVEPKDNEDTGEDANKKDSNPSAGPNDSKKATASIVSPAQEAAGKTDAVNEKDSSWRLFTDENDDFYRKWAGPMILGPFVPAVLSLIIIFTGQIVLNTYTGSCGTPLAAFVSAAISICYIFLLVYTWIFIGDDVVLEISLIETKIKILRPFKSLKWFMLVLGVIAFASFIVWCIGSSLLSSGFFCVVTSPGLYSFTLFIVVIYWLAFCIVIFYLVKLYYGDFIVQMIAEQTKAPTILELEERVFRKTFSEFDKERQKKISRENAPALVQALGVYIPDEELPALLDSLDPESTGEINFDPMFEWFQKVSAKANAAEEEEEAAKAALRQQVELEDKVSRKKDRSG